MKGFANALIEAVNRAHGQLEYNYNTGAAGLKFLGVIFSYSELRINGVRWLGKGPYRVWKNRMQGVTHDVWQKDYTDTVTGSIALKKNNLVFDYIGLSSNLR